MKKKVLAVMLVIVMVIVSFTACGGEKSDVPRIGIIQMMEHDSLNTIYENIVVGLENAGYIDGETCTIDYQNGQNDMTVMKTIVQRFVADNCDVIIAIATPAAQAALSETSEIPIIFAAVTDPVDAEIVDSMDVPGGNVTGTSDAISPEDIMNLAKEITPDFKTIGALYSTGEDNSASVIAELRKYADANGFTVVESTVTNTSEVQQAAQFLADKVDIVFSPIDNTVASAMAVATDVLYKAGVPFYVSADSMVNDGGLATYGIDYTVLGQETGEMAALVLEGSDPGTMPVRTMDDMSIYVNTNTADMLGITIPDSVMEKATVLGE